MIDTMMRVPLIHGLPWHTLGFMEIRSVHSGRFIPKPRTSTYALDPRTSSGGPGQLRGTAQIRQIFRVTSSIVIAAYKAKNWSTMELEFSTKGFNDIIEITPQVRKTIQSLAIKEGVVHLFVVGSTAALTTIEYEPGALADLQRALEQIAPMNAEYAHNEAWHDGNGYAHLRAALLKPDLCVPVQAGKLALGTWQQIILIDFDNRPRERKVIVTVTPAA
jgi:secondary thiamine-phosphate synthase enzyme